MKKQMNNKGFSLVELIVVIAIMGILAVTLAPRLTQYVDRARKAADEDTINTLLSTAKLVTAEYPLTASTDTKLTGTGLFLTSSDSGKTWTVNTGYTAANSIDQKFFDQLEKLLPGKLTFKSSQVTTNLNILISTDANGAVTVALGYNISDDADVASKETEHLTNYNALAADLKYIVSE